MKNHLLGISLANNALLEEGHIDGALKLCTSILGESQGFSYCCVFQIEPDSKSFCYSTQTKKTKDSLEKFNSGILFPEIKKELKKNLPYFGATKELKCKNYKAYLESRNIKSFLLTPIFSENKLWGYVIYENLEKVDWVYEEVHALQLFAKNIGTRIYKDKIALLLGSEIENLNYYMTGTNQAMWEFDLVTLQPTFSYYWGEMIGLEKEEIEHTYNFWRERTHPVDVLEVEKNLQDYIAGDAEEYRGIMRMIHTKGHYVWIKYSGLLKRDEEGAPIKIVGTHIDVTDIKEKEIELKKSEEKFRFITQNTSDIICQHDLDGRYTFISRSLKDTLGYEINEMMGNIAFDFIHPDDQSYVIDAHEEFIKTGKNEMLTYRFKKKDNSYIWLESSSTNITDKENVVIGLQSCSRDVSERIETAKKMEIALATEKEFSKMKSDFVSMASHQFRTPLTVIYSNTELLELKSSLLEQKAQDVIAPISNRIQTEVHRMTELMNNILVFAKYETHKLKKDIKSLHFNELIQTLISTYFSTNEDGREITLNVIGDEKPFYSDESLLIHILTNLISNAFKYSKGKPSPTLSIQYLEHHIQIEIIDFGIGIPQQDVAQLFTSFFRASNTNTIVGSGLGLTIVKQFTHFLNGTIELKTKENEGTKITLQFPYEHE